MMLCMEHFFAMEVMSCDFFECLYFLRVTQFECVHLKTVIKNSAYASTLDRIEDPVFALCHSHFIGLSREFVSWQQRRR